MCMNSQPSAAEVEEEVEEEEIVAEIAADVMAFVEPADHVPLEEGGHVIKQGWLHKMGKINTQFQKRWFELEADALRYYKTSDGKAGHLQPRGMIAIESITGVAEESRRGENVFELHTPKRTYFLRASDEHYVHEWVHELRKCAKLTRTYSVHRSDSGSPERPSVRKTNQA